MDILLKFLVSLPPKNMNYQKYLNIFVYNMQSD